MTEPDRAPALAEMGEALMRRMIELGLPVTGDVAVDVAAFERHTRANGSVVIGSWAGAADELAPRLATAFAAADTHRGITLTRADAQALIGILGWLRGFRDEISEQEARR